MAATMSAWAKPGAGSWALDSEEHEAELQQPQPQQKAHENNDGAADFPSLSAAVSAKPKKKKGQTLSLAEFTTYSSSAKPASPSKGLTPEDLMALPTGPRQRTAEELDRSRLGGGFRSYGLSGDRNRYSNGEDSSNSRWGSNSRVSEEGRRNGGGGGFGRDSSRELAPSRADEIDNWAAGKKSPVGNGFERKERDRGGFFDSQSRADESDSWVSNKSFVPTVGRRYSGGGGGFDREKRSGFEANTNGGGADSESWGKKREEESGIANGGGRPRLNLQPRTLPVSKDQEQAPETVAKPKASNPFGEARPREEVLKEKGQDYKKIDEQLESIKIKEVSSGSTESEAWAKEGPAFGKRSFGSGNGRVSPSEDRTERSWRKTESVDVRPPSAEKVEDVAAEEN